MSFSWANKLAKNALLQAQKRIDAVLDIDEPEEEEEGEEGDAQRDGEEREETESVSPTAKDSTTDELSEVGCSQHEGNSNLSADDWSSFLSSSSKQIVVDTEPNPIRDSHDPPHEQVPSLHPPHSPSSNSPDEENSSHTSSKESRADQSARFPPDTIVHDVTREDSLIDASADTISGEVATPELDKHDDQRSVRSTLASSDIEIIKHVDNWSVSTSSNNHHSRMSVGDLTDVPLLLLKDSSCSDEHWRDQITLLQSKLTHRERRIEELGRVNDNLKTSNANLAAKNKHIMAMESKLQKQLSEKQKELGELMDEGKRLSEHSGKQAKELRKLKAQATQLEALTNARDGAVKELQAAQKTIRSQAKEIEELMESLAASERSMEGLRSEVEQAQSSSGIVQNQISEQFTQMDTLRAENCRLEKELKLMNERREELAHENQQLNSKLLNQCAKDSRVGAREQSLLEELDVERTRSAQLKDMMRELERRVEALVEQQRETALKITETSAPLLNSISELEAKLHQLEAQNGTLTRQLQQRSNNTEAESEEKRSLVESVALLRRKIDEERTSIAAETNRLRDEKIRLLSQMKELEEVASLKEAKLGEKLRATSDKLISCDRELTLKMRECGDLREECSTLRQRLKEMAVAPRTSTPTSQPQPALATLGHHGHNVPVAGDQESPNPAMQAAMAGLSSAVMPASNRRTKPERDGSGSGPMRVDMIFARTDDESSHSEPSTGGKVNLRMELEDCQNQLYGLREKFDLLLEMYGACLETIDEMKYDNEDLRKLCKEQALRLVKDTNNICAEKCETAGL